MSAAVPTARLGIDGRKLMDEEPDATTFDLVLKNTPVFIANTTRPYLFIEEIGNDAPTYLARGMLGLHQLLSDFFTGKGTLQQPDRAWDELLAFLGAVVYRSYRDAGQRVDGRVA